MTTQYTTAAQPQYLPGMDVDQYCHVMITKHPLFAELLSFDRPGTDIAVDTLIRCQNEFETNDAGGRGDSYRQAQRDVAVRWTGMAHLLSLAGDVSQPADLPPHWRLLDVLGGDGTVVRALQSTLPQRVWSRTVLTSDIAGQMVSAALAQGLPAIRQAAQFLFLREGMMDAVLLAYGTHHIPPADRLRACHEAHRVLRERGTIVIHDFEETSPVAQWFNVVVDGHVGGGHRYQHFTPEQMSQYLGDAGFHDIEVQHVYDPLIVRAPTSRQAYDRMGDYVLHMYGLVGLLDGGHPSEMSRRHVWELLRRHLRYDGGPWATEPDVYRDGDGWVAEVPRVALVARGRR